MPKVAHEVLDPIHGFIHFTSDERGVIDSRPVQRLRNVHQLGLSYMVYPCANHTRFEHSLGVMHLAGLVFDAITNPDSLTDEIRAFFPDIGRGDFRAYWRMALRMGALCHDIGHPPFSHTAEELFPPGWYHERLTAELISSAEMQELWKRMAPMPRAEHVVKLAIGREKGERLGLTFTPWEDLLSDVVTGDAFGVDRIDYLLRDSHHVGIASGKFDHLRLIESLRILVPRDEKQKSLTPVIGLQQGGRYSAHALLIARHFMYAQVYYHPVNRSYGLHFKDFLSQWLTGSRFPIDLNGHLNLTDSEVASALFSRSRDGGAGHIPASRIVNRGHFRVLYERRPGDADQAAEPGQAVFNGARAEFGDESVRHDRKTDKPPTDFAIQLRDGTVKSAAAFSDANMPVGATVDYVFIAPEIREQARTWLRENLETILNQAAQAEGEE